MKLIMFPLLFSLACIAAENKDKIIDQYNAAYPADPAKNAAIEQCIEQNHSFNRLDADDRKHCYRQTLGPVAIAAAPTPSPYYPYNPSHLSGNDIRRQEANDGYRLSIIQPAAAAEVGPHKPSPQAPAAAHHATPASLPVRQHVASTWQSR